MAFDAYLKFAEPLVQGQAVVDKPYELHGNTNITDWINMEEYSFAASMAVSSSRSSGTGAATTGKGKLEPFTFKKIVDATSTSLAFHAAAGTIFKRIVVNLFASLGDGGGATHKPHRFLSIIMTGGVINSCKFSGGGGDELPTEEISIAYGAIQYTYWNYTIDAETGAITPGSITAPFYWNTITNTGDKNIKLQ